MISVCKNASHYQPFSTSTRCDFFVEEAKNQGNIRSFILKKIIIFDQHPPPIVHPPFLSIDHFHLREIQ